MAKKPAARSPLAPAAKQRGESLQQQTAARRELEAYNASQGPAPKPAVNLDTNGILSARGAGEGGGSGEGAASGGPRRYRATPLGTFPTSAAPVVPERTLRDALTRLGPYSPGRNMERDAMSAARQRDWALTQQQPRNLRDVLQLGMINNPRAAGKVRGAIDAYNLTNRGVSAADVAAARAMEDDAPAASEGTQRAQRGRRYDAQTEAGMENVTSAAGGIKGATRGRINGKDVFIPAAGAANRAAFAAGADALGLDGSGPVGPDAAIWKQYKQAAAVQFAAREKARKEAAAAMALEALKGNVELEKERIKAGGTNTKSRSKEESVLMGDFGATRASVKAAYQSALNTARGEVDRTFAARESNALQFSPEQAAEWQIGGEKYKAALSRIIVERGLDNPESWMKGRVRDKYMGALGTTPDREWTKQKAVEFWGPGYFDEWGQPSMVPVAGRAAQGAANAAASNPVLSGSAPSPPTVHAGTPADGARIAAVLDRNPTLAKFRQEPAPPPRSELAAFGAQAGAQAAPPQSTPAPPAPHRGVNPAAFQISPPSAERPTFGAQGVSLADPAEYAAVGISHPLNDQEILSLPPESLRVAIEGMSSEVGSAVTGSPIPEHMRGEIIASIEKAKVRLAQLERPSQPDKVEAPRPQRSSGFY